MAKVSLDRISEGGRAWQFADGAHDVSVKGFAENLLKQRGIEDTEAFLHPTLKGLMPDPALIPNIAAAAERLADAILADEGVTIIADFDVDGASSASLLFRYLGFFGLRPLVEVPERLSEGFGPNKRILDSIVARGSDLVLCLDCGTAAVELFTAYANRLQVIIADHHQPEGDLPPVYAVVNPMCSPEGQKAFGDLAAVGVVFMLLVATNSHLRGLKKDVPDLRDYLDVVALGTICDVVPVRGVNRAFVHRGLELINTKPSAGIAALLQTSGLKNKTVRPEDIGFSIGPKLNAGSRQGFSSLPWQILTQEDPEQARQFALHLGRLNNKRKQDSTALANAAQDVMQQREGFVLASADHWPLGILGILAGRISRRLHKPCLIIGYDEHGDGSGSGRSVAGIDLGALLQKAVAEGLLLRGGGHAMAGGFGINKDKEAAFIDFLDKHITALKHETPSVMIDAALRLKDCKITLLRELQRLEPFGDGNPEPLLHLHDVRLRNVTLMGTEHLRAEIIDADYNTLSAVMFSEAQSPLGKFLQQHTAELELLVRLKPDFRHPGRVSAHIEDARI